MKTTSNKLPAKTAIKSSPNFKIPVVFSTTCAAADSGALYFCLTLNFFRLIQVVQDLYRNSIQELFPRNMSFQTKGLNIILFRELFIFL